MAQERKIRWMNVMMIEFMTGNGHDANQRARDSIRNAGIHLAGTAGPGTLLVRREDGPRVIGILSDLGFKDEPL